MKTYLVTGAAGFIGANFIKYLLNRKYKNEDIKVTVIGHTQSMKEKEKML